MKQLNKTIYPKKQRKIKIMQFGEGNFLRAFVDWIVQKMNDKGVISSDVVVVQPLKSGRIAELESQDGLYTLYLEGINNGQVVKTHEIIDVLNDYINPYTQYEKYLSYAASPELDVIVSNTTEAGIVLDENDTDFSVCPESFPAKLLAFLRARYEHFNGDKTKGLAIIPCELIDNNAKELKKALLALAKIKGYDAQFIDWLENYNYYSSTLVDRIVPGYPKDRIDEITKETGYMDNSVVMGEIFHLWVLEKQEQVQQIFPADKCGLNVIYADDIKPYKERKVKILNGSHTALVPIAYLSGIDTVGEAMNDPIIKEFIRKLIFDEINPTINLPQNEMTAFAESVLERYENPFVRHELMSIALNSTTKFKTRLLPTLNDYVRIKAKLPQNLLFAFAALIMFHKADRNGQQIMLNDSPEYLEQWKAVWSGEKDSAQIVKEVCAWSVWEQDLTKLHVDFVAKVAEYLEELRKKGAKIAVSELVKK